jgi:hypothetical protein
MLSSPNAYLAIARVFVALFSRFAQNFTMFLCPILHELHQVRYTTEDKRTQKIRTSTQLRESLCTGSQDMLVLSSDVA